MDSKHYTEVLIDGKIYTLGGYEDESYMQRVASYINEMITTLRKREGFTKQNAEYQSAMIQLNMADDYFKAREQIAILEQQKADMEKEVYSLKHELVTTQMKLEAANRRRGNSKGAGNSAAESDDQEE
jgi:cell division protein ZapA